MVSISVNHYKDNDKVEELIKNGSLSSLGEEIGVKHNFEDRKDSMCKFYGRDRGEENVAEISDNIQDFLVLCRDSWAEYTYIYINGE